MKWLKRLWWRITKQPTLAQYGEKVTITQRLRIARNGGPGDVHVLNGTDQTAYKNFTHGPSAFGVPLPATINFINTHKRRIPPTDLDTPESQEALAELNEAQKEAQTPPTDR